MDSNTLLLAEEHERAVELFRQEKYKEAFEKFASVYNGGYEQEQVLALLNEAYYEPNQEDLAAMYQKNVRLLQEYPYVWERRFEDLESLPFRLYPIDDNEYMVYDKTQRRFIETYAPLSEKETPYFCEDLSNCLLIENETNAHNLRFLFDTVRRSEDCAMDNHIYLYYENVFVLARLLQTADLEPLLEHQKFVFLIGEENRKKYPISFSKEFGIDYAAYEPQPLRIEEMNRMCFWYKHPHSGTVFSCGVLDTNKYIVFFGGHDLHVRSFFHGETLLATKRFRDSVEDVEKEYAWQDLNRLVDNPDLKMHIPDFEQDVERFRTLFADRKTFTSADLFRAYFILQYEKKQVNSRIVPVILYDPHVWDPRFYNNIFKTFSYKTVLTCMREPIQCFARCYQKTLVVWNQFQTEYILASDYVHTQFLSPEFRDMYYGFRFEDLKTKPEQVLRPVCRLLNIPFDPAMLAAEAPMLDEAGNTIRGFEKTAMERNIDSVLTEFDRMRLNIFYEPIHRYYGYPAFDSKEYPIGKSTALSLFRLPFHFEYHYRELFLDKSPEEVDLRRWIYDMMQKCYTGWRSGNVKITFPKLVYSDAVQEADAPQA